MNGVLIRKMKSRISADHVRVFNIMSTEMKKERTVLDKVDSSRDRVFQEQEDSAEYSLWFTLLISTMLHVCARHLSYILLFNSLTI